MEDEIAQKREFLNRDVIKYVAMATMLLNHIANVFFTRDTFWFTLFVNIGYFTAVTMCYFMVEGYGYTHSKKKYALRLLIFAVISEVPFCLAFTQYGLIRFHGMNMIWTLFLCFLINLTADKVKKPWLKALIILGLILASGISDWPFMATLFTVFFIWAKGSRKRKFIAYGGAMLVYALFEVWNDYGWYPVSHVVLSALYGMIAIACSGVCILFFYNGKRIEKGRTFSKWFFYVFYPAHLLILGLIRIATMK
jgi:hypothetical protein